MMSTPEKQHEWLRKFVGTWTFTSEGYMGPDKPTCASSGRETVRMLGDLWIVCEARMQMPAEMGGGSMESLMTLGYDPAKKKYIGTWIGSPMTHLFVYEGVLKESFDEQGKAVSILPLDTTGPSFMDPTKTARYQDVLEMHDGGKRVMWSQALGDDGVWMRFMTAQYTRES